MTSSTQTAQVSPDFPSFSSLPFDTVLRSTVDGVEIPVSKSILVIASSAFKRLFDLQLAETRVASVNRGEHEVFSNVLVEH